MRPRTAIAIVVAAVLMLPPAASAGQGRNRDPQEPARSGEPQRDKAEPRQGPAPSHAEPRQPAEPPRQAEPRRPEPPPRVESRNRPPASGGYRFRPLGPQRGFYYHPQFGFYFGPYYGPYYPPAGSYFWPLHQVVASVRLRVRPVDAQVFVNGYYAGVVDDFDGLLQRLYLPPGQHEIEIYLQGYRPYREKLLLQPGSSREIRLTLSPLASGEALPPLPGPTPLPEEWTAAGRDDAASSAFGILAVRIEPSDAQIVIDGEEWLGSGPSTELVIHAAAGTHRIEVRKNGYTTFKVDVDLSSGARTRLVVRLDPTR
jgi:hypothetical protein